MRTTYPALELIINVNDGWSRLEHKIHPSKGWFCWKEAPIYIGFDKGLGNQPRTKYEKWVFQSFSFIEDVLGGLPSISVDENQIISKSEISQEEFNSQN